MEDGESVQNEKRIYLQDVTAAEQEDREAVSGSRVEGDTWERKTTDDEVDGRWVWVVDGWDAGESREGKEKLESVIRRRHDKQDTCLINSSTHFTYI